MPRACTICTHPEHDAIDRALVDGASLRDIAGQYGVSKNAVDRHKAEHLPSIMVKSKEASEIAHADHLLAEANRLYRVATTIMDTNLAKKPMVTLQAVRVAGRILELLGELMGELQRTPTVNIHLSAEWLEVRAVLVQALQPYPEARTAVAAALSEVERVNG
jgi:hypothetical protein